MVEPVLRGGGQAVAAGFADGGQDLARYPLAEPSGLRLPAGENKVVEAAFIDDAHFLRAAKGVGSNDTLFIFVQPVGRIATIGDVQHAAHIGQHKPWFAA